MNPPTQGQVIAVARHVVTAACAVVATLGVVHIVNAQQMTDATAALNQIGSGVMSIITGVSTLIGVGSAVYAGLSASPLWQIFNVSKLPNTVVVTTPSIAAATPTLPNVVSNTEAKVVSK